MNLPKTISPCPIIEAVLEVRFKTSVPKSAVFGIFYNKLKEWLKSEPQDLPILQIPEQIRQHDNSLNFKPYYQFKKENLVVQIGPDVCLISSTNEYMGWEHFSKEIFKLLDIILDSGIIESFLRLGFRYINFFEEEIYNSINVDINLNDKPIDYNNTVLSTSLRNNNFSSTLTISNHSIVNNRNGSIIDIDTFMDIKLSVEEFKLKYRELIEEGHSDEKKLFYQLLKKDFLTTLNPKY